MTQKVRDALRADFGVATDEEATRRLLGDLDADVGLTPLRSDKFDSEGHFHLLGSELRIHVEFASGQMVVRRVTAESSSFLDRERDRAHTLSAKFVVATPNNPPDAEQALADLRNAVVDRAAERARSDKEQGRRRVFSQWRRTLQALTTIERGREHPLEYVQFRRHSTSVEFVLAAPVQEDVLGQTRVAPLVDGGLLRGELVRATTEGLVMRIDQGDPKDLPAKGLLRVDTRMARSALRRQEIALDVVQRRAAVRPDLEDILLSPSVAAEPRVGDEPQWCQTSLDSAKREAVVAALGRPDAMLVEDPPGTGKTTFITELIVQELRRDPDARILVSSQTHAALDNVLERLAELDGDLALLRLGRPNDERIAPGVRELLIGEQLVRWRKDVIRQGRASVRAWARARGLSKRDVEIAMRYEELASVGDASDNVELDRLEREEHLELLRSERRSGGHTANETIGSVQDQIAEVELQQRELEATADELAERLKALGAISGTNAVVGVSASELRERGAASVDQSHPDIAECRERLRLLADWHGQFGRGPEFEAAALVRAQVVAATCVGFGGTPGWDSIEFDLCIVDEASKATATELLIPMTRACRWVLVGDHRQLPPYVDEALLDRGLLRDHDLTEDAVRETLFERLRSALPERCRFMLSTQHRMVPAIGDLISTCFYDGELRSAESEPPSWLKVVLPSSVTWLSTAHLPGRREQRSGSSQSNPLEARCIANLLGSLNFVAGGAGERLRVGVLTGYSDQRDELERRVAEKRGEWVNLTIECNTVDAFQGRQVDVAIYSVTRSNVGGRLGFLKERRRLNVALSRGRVGLAIVGDDQFVAMADGDNPFTAVVQFINADPRCSVDEALS